MKIFLSTLLLILISHSLAAPVKHPPLYDEEIWELFKPGWEKLGNGPELDLYDMESIIKLIIWIENAALPCLIKLEEVRDYAYFYDEGPKCPQLQDSYPLELMYQEGLDFFSFKALAHRVRVQLPHKDTSDRVTRLLFQWKIQVDRLLIKEDYLKLYFKIVSENKDVFKTELLRIIYEIHDRLRELKESQFLFKLYDMRLWLDDIIYHNFVKMCRENQFVSIEQLEEFLAYYRYNWCISDAFDLDDLKCPKNDITYQDPCYSVEFLRTPKILKLDTNVSEEEFLEISEFSFSKLVSEKTPIIQKEFGEYLKAEKVTDFTAWLKGPLADYMTDVESLQSHLPLNKANKNIYNQAMEALEKIHIDIERLARKSSESKPSLNRFLIKHEYLKLLAQPVVTREDVKDFAFENSFRITGDDERTRILLQLQSRGITPANFLKQNFLTFIHENGKSICIEDLDQFTFANKAFLHPEFFRERPHSGDFDALTYLRDISSASTTSHADASLTPLGITIKDVLS